MFIGEFKHNLDEKGRMAIPAKMRALLKDGAMITRGLDNCLFLYTKEGWETEAADLKKLSKFNPKAREVLHNFFSGSAEVEFDGQGRTNIPENLRRFAKLKKKAVVVGMYDRLEIWDEEMWNEYRQKAEQNNDQNAEALAGIGM